MSLIATRLRQPLPKGFSYPIGAEVISAALAPTVPFERLGLLFSTPYADNVMVVLCEREDWRIVVNRVPTSLRSSVHAQLVSEGLQRIVDWMNHDRPETWYLRRHQLVIGYGRDGSLHYAEFTG
jgi:hypothetical protein